MAAIIIKYQLADGVTREQFEEWVKTEDQPTMRGLARVASFNTYRVTGKLIGEGEPSVTYVELFDVPDLAGFTGEDMPGAAVQAIMGAFMGMVKDPEFLVAEAV
jgi:REDY-like protein HapK